MAGSRACHFLPGRPCYLLGIICDEPADVQPSELSEPAEDVHLPYQTVEDVHLPFETIVIRADFKPRLREKFEDVIGSRVI